MLVALIGQTPAEPAAYVIRPSHECAICWTSIGSGARPGDVVCWEIPPQVSHQITGEGREIGVWLVCEKADGTLVPFEVGKFRGACVVYPRVGRPWKREFVFVVK